MLNDKEKVDFFNELTLKSSSNDCQYIKKIYYALLEVVRDGLSKNRIIELPNFGEFKVIIVKGMTTKSKQTGERITLPPHGRVTFKPHYRLKNYFSEQK